MCSCLRRRSLIRRRRSGFGRFLSSLACDALAVPKTERVRDPIHQFVYLSPEEWEAVDSPVFQRLRRIGQLAMTHLVYPGTTHTRFEHSIGVRHVASLLAEQLKLSEDERRPVLHAALLHDVGHETSLTSPSRCWIS